MPAIKGTVHAKMKTVYLLITCGILPLLCTKPAGEITQTKLSLWYIYVSMLHSQHIFKLNNLTGSPVLCAVTLASREVIVCSEPKAFTHVVAFLISVYHTSNTQIYSMYHQVGISFNYHTLQCFSHLKGNTSSGRVSWILNPSLKKQLSNIVSVTV